MKNPDHTQDDTAPRPAGFWIRLAAAIIDLIPVVGLTWVFAWVLSLTRPPAGIGQPSDHAQETVVWIYLGMSLLYHVGFIAVRGATPGKQVLGIRVVRWGSGNRVNIAQALSRWLGYIVSSCMFGAGYLMAAFQPRKRALHDLLAGTCAIRSAPVKRDPSGLPDK